MCIEEIQKQKQGYLENYGIQSMLPYEAYYTNIYRKCSNFLAKGNNNKKKLANEYFKKKKEKKNKIKNNILKVNRKHKQFIY